MQLRLLLPVAFLGFVAVAAAACGGSGDDANPFESQGDDADSADSGGNAFEGDGADEDCRFRVNLSGAVDQEINWDAGCGGLANEGNIDIVFTDGRDSEGLVFLISVSGIERGKTGTDSTATVSILGTVDEDTAIFHGTEEGDCTLEITNSKELESGFGGAVHAIKGRINCTEPATGAFGNEESIEMSEIEFESQVVWAN